MRSMVEGRTEAECPSTTLRVVPLPIAFGDREEREGARHLPTIGKSSPCSRAQSMAIS